MEKVIIKNKSLKILLSIALNANIINNALAPGVDGSKITNALSLFAIGVGGVINNPANIYFININTHADDTDPANGKRQRYEGLTNAPYLCAQGNIDISISIMSNATFNALLAARNNTSYNFNQPLNNLSYVRMGLDDIIAAVNAVPESESEVLDKHIAAKATVARIALESEHWTQEQFLRSWNPEYPVRISLNRGVRTSDETFITLCGAVANLAKGIAPSGKLYNELITLAVSHAKKIGDTALRTEALISALIATHTFRTDPSLTQEFQAKLADPKKVDSSLDKIQELSPKDLNVFKFIGRSILDKKSELPRVDLIDYTQYDFLRKLTAFDIQNESELPCDRIRNIMEAVKKDGVQSIPVLQTMITLPQHQRFTVACTEARALITSMTSAVNPTATTSNTDNNTALTAAPAISSANAQVQTIEQSINNSNTIPHVIDTTVNAVAPGTSNHGNASVRMDTINHNTHVNTTNDSDDDIVDNQVYSSALSVPGTDISRSESLPGPSGIQPLDLQRINVQRAIELAFQAGLQAGAATAQAAVFTAPAPTPVEHNIVQEVAPDTQAPPLRRGNTQVVVDNNTIASYSTVSSDAGASSASIISDIAVADLNDVNLHNVENGNNSAGNNVTANNNRDANDKNSTSGNSQWTTVSSQGF